MSESNITTPKPAASAKPHDGLCDEQGPIPMFGPRGLDEQGRLIPLSPEEQRARSEAAIRALKAIAKIPDQPGDDELWREVMRGIDAQRPHRPLFEGMY